MNERIKALIETLGIKRVEFARRLNLSQPFVSDLCSGKGNPSDRTISDICRIWNVSEAWLREGAGEMFQPRTRRDEIAAFMGDLLSGPEDFKTRLISVLANLDDAQWALLADMAEKLAETEKAGQD
jgi:transcriptional regulator with XRE-family HTH domain